MTFVILSGCQSAGNGYNASQPSYFNQYKKIKNQNNSSNNNNNNNNYSSSSTTYQPESLNLDNYTQNEKTYEKPNIVQNEIMVLEKEYGINKNEQIHYPSKPIKQDYDKHNIVDSPAMHKATMRKYKVLGSWYYPSTAKIGKKYIGVASWYGPNFHGKQTSNGETYDMNKYTAAHKTLPMNTVVKVINLKNNKSVKVRINDRGPFVDDRIIDLSFKAAKALDVYEHGTVKVQLEILGFNAVTGISSKSEEEFKEKYLNNINLQIGVFSNKQTATKIASRNETEDYVSKVVKYEDRKNNRTLYRVILKNFKSEQEAKDFKERMNLKGSFITGE